MPRHHRRAAIEELVSPIPTSPRACPPTPPPTPPPVPPPAPRNIVINCEGARIGNDITIGSNIINAAGSLAGLIPEPIPPVPPVFGDLQIFGSYFGPQAQRFTLNVTNTSDVGFVTSLNLPLLDLFAPGYTLVADPIVGSPLRIVDNVIVLDPINAPDGIAPGDSIDFSFSAVGCGDCVLRCAVPLLDGCGFAFDYVLDGLAEVGEAVITDSTAASLRIVGSNELRLGGGTTTFTIYNNSLIEVSNLIIELDRLTGIEGFQSATYDQVLPADLFELGPVVMPPKQTIQLKVDQLLPSGVTVVVANYQGTVPCSSSYCSFDLVAYQYQVSGTPESGFVVFQ